MAAAAAGEPALSEEVAESALAPRPLAADDAVPGPALHVALVEPDIPWNTGNVGRTCVATGAHLHLIEPLGFDLDDRAVRRSGLDYWQFVKLQTWPSWQEFEHSMADLGRPWFFSAEAEQTIWQVDLSPPALLIFGDETRGLPPKLRERYRDRLVRLPMVEGSVRSLNLSTAAGIAIYEALRQRHLGSGFPRNLSFT